MLGSEYIKINNTKYTPSTFSYKSDAVENSMVSESGHDMVVAVRLKKYVFSLSWEGITYELMSELENYCYEPMVNFKWKGVTYECRAREGSSGLVNYSWKYKRSDGLWNFSMTLKQL